MAYKGKRKPEPEDDNKPIEVPFDFTLTVKMYAIELFPELSGVEMTPEMEGVLWIVEHGNTLNKACEHYGIARPIAEYWKAHNRLFAECIRLLLHIRALDMEDKMLLDGVKGKLADIPMMYAIKGNLPQYRDNYLPPPSGISNVTIFLDGTLLNQQAGLIAANNKRVTEIEPDHDKYDDNGSLDHV